MTSLELPTLQRLKSQIPPGVSAVQISQEWLNQFTSALESDIAGVGSLFLENGFWRDQIALSWDFRTIQGSKRILQFLQERLSVAKLCIGALVEDRFRAPALSKPFPDLVFVQFSFAFETEVGTGTGTCRLVNAEGIWKAYTMYTALEALAGFPEKTGALRDATIEHGDWAAKRATESEFANESPVVLVVGAGHTGLALGARLKALGVRALLVEQKPRVGDNVVARSNAIYEVYYPSTWPVYAPAAKLGDWLESFAKSLELDIWTSSKVEHARWNEPSKTWSVDVRRGGRLRTMEVKHLVLATGIGGGVPSMPAILDQNVFKGEVLHSSQFHSAEDYSGKNVVVVGAGSSGHDIAHDFANHDGDVTMYQRSETVVVAAKTFNAGLSRLYNEEIPTEIADHLSASLPIPINVQFHRRIFPYLASTTEKAMLEGLEKTGFKTSLGPENGGPLPLVFERAGGYYLNTGASQHIIDGKIKMKNGGSIERFVENGLRFSDGSELEADAIIFATGFGDPRDVAKDICGPEIRAKLAPAWGITPEGELGSIWRESGQVRLWFAAGNLAISRYASKFLALRIKAEEEGLVRVEPAGDVTQDGDVLARQLLEGMEGRLLRMEGRLHETEARLAASEREVAKLRNSANLRRALLKEERKEEQKATKRAHRKQLRIQWQLTEYCNAGCNAVAVANDILGADFQEDERDDALEVLQEYIMDGRMVMSREDYTAFRNDEEAAKKRRKPGMPRTRYIFTATETDDEYGYEH
ncbi:hypothetical protein EVJ58_g883 [Rhodofomes roseus]|uniref:FAD/NAD(P)-binding domain-containing protein n=1 Tax=Rhodofomes roseus TaxID=34475 RepID=A0A4Y9Z1E5_9APHY|nr:hypothetical protein EVJ58_g883 [Rhodofomes roseus]